MQRQPIRRKSPRRGLWRRRASGGPQRLLEGGRAGRWEEGLVEAGAARHRNVSLARAGAQLRLLSSYPTPLLLGGAVVPDVRSGFA